MVMLVREVLLFMDEILPEGEMRHIAKISKEDGTFTVLVELHKRRVELKAKYDEKFSDYFLWVPKESRTRKFPPADDRHWDEAVRDAYNVMWDYLADNKINLVEFFSRGGTGIFDSDSWDCGYDGEPFSRSYAQLLKDGCGDLEFVVGYNNDSIYAIDTLINSNLGTAWWYDESASMNKRSFRGSSGEGRIPVKTRVTDRMYLNMGFCMLYNQVFRAFLRRTVVHFPEAGCFPHWMYALQMGIYYGNDYMPAHMVVVIAFAVGCSSRD